MITKSKIKGLLSIGEITTVDGSTMATQISDMMGNLAVSTPVLRITRDILSKEVTVVEKETGLVDTEITNRMLNVKGFEDFISDLSFNIFGEFMVYEKVYEVPEGGNLQLGQLIRLPNNYVGFDIEKYKSTEGWYYANKDGDEIAIKQDDFLISVYGYTIDYPMGYGLFRNGVTQAWTDLNSLEGQIRALSLKYGAVIPVFGYNPIEAETNEGMQKLQDRVDGIREIAEGTDSVLGIPLTGRGATLKDGFQFISLSDLNVDMHNILIGRLEDKLETFLMGARFSKTDSGSQAKDQVQADQKDKMMFHITKVITKELDKLLIDDAELFGYDPALYTFEMNEFLTEREKVEKRSRELSIDKQESDNKNDAALTLLSQVKTVAKLKFEGIDDNTIADMMGLDIAFVTPIKAKDVDTTEKSATRAATVEVSN